MRKITIDDLVPRIWDWTKISSYAITCGGMLIRYKGPLSDGFPVYECLYDGWWEATEVGVGIREIAEAEPVNFKVASAIIRKEEKPRHLRPAAERDYWITC